MAHGVRVYPHADADLTPASELRPIVAGNPSAEFNCVELWAALCLAGLALAAGMVGAAEANLYPPAHNGLVAGSSPGEPFTISMADHLHGGAGLRPRLQKFVAAIALGR